MEVAGIVAGHGSRVELVQPHLRVIAGANLVEKPIAMQIGGHTVDRVAPVGRAVIHEDVAMPALGKCQILGRGVKCDDFGIQTLKPGVIGQRVQQLEMSRLQGSGQPAAGMKEQGWWQCIQFGPG